MSENSLIWRIIEDSEIIDASTRKDSLAVTNGVLTFRCENKKAAGWLCDRLNNRNEQQSMASCKTAEERFNNYMDKWLGTEPEKLAD